MKAVQKSYRLLKYGDPLLNKVSTPVKLPYGDDVDHIIDECINSLVTSQLTMGIEERRRFLEPKVDLLRGPAGGAPLACLRDVRESFLVPPDAHVQEIYVGLQPFSLGVLPRPLRRLGGLHLQ